MTDDAPSAPDPRRGVARLHHPVRWLLAGLTLMCVVSAATGLYSVSGRVLVVMAGLGFCDICLVALRQPPDGFTLP